VLETRKKAKRLHIASKFRCYAKAHAHLKEYQRHHHQEAAKKETNKLQIVTK
jgi:hypothetical protein